VKPDTQDHQMLMNHFQRSRARCCSLAVLSVVAAMVTSLAASAHANAQLPASKEAHLKDALELAATMVRKGDFPAARANVERVDQAWDGAEPRDSKEALASRIADRAIDRGLDRVVSSLQPGIANFARSDRALSDLLSVLEVLHR
jgi:hypothetical protein